MSGENPSEEHPGLAEVERVVEGLKKEVEGIKRTLRGDELSDAPGVVSRLSGIERQYEDLKNVVDGFKRNEEQRDRDARAREKKLADEVKAREEKRDKFQGRAVGLLTIIVGGIATQLILMWLTGGIGG